MAEVFPLTNARSRLGELVRRARFGRERLVISEHGRPVAAIISVDELAELQAAADAADLARAEAVRAQGLPGIPHQQVVAAMAALDAADEAATPQVREQLLAPHADVLARAEAAADALEPRS